uniref:Uncharacterized protein n=1 Tax=Graphocephala atropunctata TaxID=36148 RepID=A0A1B6LUF3_9HEMI
MLLFILLIATSASSQKPSDINTTKECGKLNTLCENEATCCLGLTCINTTTNGTQAPYHCETEELALRALNLQFFGTLHGDINVNPNDNVRSNSTRSRRRQGLLRRLINQRRKIQTKAESNDSGTSLNK